MNRDSENPGDGSAWNRLSKLTGLGRANSAADDFAESGSDTTDVADDNSAAARFAEFKAIQASIIRSSPIVPDLSMSDPDLRRIVEDFVKRLQNDIVELQKLAAADDFEAIASIAHRLKGSAGTLGFPAFSDPSAKLETAARDHNEPDVSDQLSVIADLATRILIPPAPDLR